MRRTGRSHVVVPFLLPALAVYTVIFVYPAFDAIRVSLFQWNGFTTKMTYIGFGNYHRLLADPTFWDSLRNTAVITIGGGIGIFGLAFFFSAILQREIRGKKFFRAIMFFPIVLPGVGVGMIWQFVYNRSWGPLSAFLNAVGLESLDQTWLGPNLIIPSLTIAVIWTYMGFYLVILMAGIDKIPKSYFEAARMDGASEWRTFWLVTLPMTWDVLVVAMVLWLISAMKIFDLIVATTFPSPPRSGFTMTIFVWERAVGAYTPVFELGYATAIGVVLLFCVVLGVAVLRLITRRERIEY
ncbi:MAG: raffinose/stachyose/melibiose transport system permease protein [Kribbellaceae bacterium]|nr:raffinose/stachyose/melibiose transport system permease protein [Kribbellaceae bacterium]